MFSAKWATINDHRTRRAKIYYTLYGQIKLLCVSYRIWIIWEHYNYWMDKDFVGLSEHQCVVGDPVVCDNNTICRIAGNSFQEKIFAYFATKLEWQKINRGKFGMFKLNPLFTVHYAHVFCESCRGEVWLAAMALLRYMTILPQHNAELQDPAGPLSSSLPSTAIEQANVAITRVRQDEEKKTNAKWAPYHECNTLFPYSSPTTSSKRRHKVNSSGQKLGCAKINPLKI